MSNTQFRACILSGAIGDSWGSEYENVVMKDDANIYYWGGKRAQPGNRWIITDNTQLTLATCEALCDARGFSPEILAEYFVQYYKQRKLSGIGASTMKAIVELEQGIHWSQAGRGGEYAAGNGAAMRIAPLAFLKAIDREVLRNICRITHRNDEAYTGALAVVLSMRAVVNSEWDDKSNLLELITPQLPDTSVRDRLIEINNLGIEKTIADIARLGCTGYVVDSIPLAIYSATKVLELGMEKMFEQIIAVGGDTDTNASIAGQIAGVLVGMDGIPESLLNKLKLTNNYDWIIRTIERTESLLEKR